jgi:hypothetical protein
MDSNKAQQLSDEIESTLSEILPDLYQSLQAYPVSSTLEIHLFNLADDTVSSAGSCVCNGVIQKPCNCGVTSDPSLPGLDSEKAQQLCADVDLKLSTILPRLSRSAQQSDESFKLHFLIDPATVDPVQSVACQWINCDILQCSNSPNVANSV